MSTILSVIDAMKATEGFVRPMREGEEVLQAGFVIGVGLKERTDGGVLHIQALVLRTSGVNSQHPYLVDVWVDLDQEYGCRCVDVKSLECQCTAGQSAKCKHIVAVMLYLARTEEKDLADLSCTDLEQQWGSLKSSTLKEYEAKRMADMCHVEKKRDVYATNIPEVTPEMKKKWIDRLIHCAPLSEYSIFFSGLRCGLGVTDSEEDVSSPSVEHCNLVAMLVSYRSWMALRIVHHWTQQKLSEIDCELRVFYEEHIQVTYEEAVAICAAAQGTDIWSQCRKRCLNASKARSQYTYYANTAADWNKRYKALYHSDFRGNVDTDMGLENEGQCREIYEDNTGEKVMQSGLLIRPEVAWLGASLDGTVVSATGDFLKNIEIKTLKEGKRLTPDELIAMRAVKTLDENGNIKKTNDHYAQMQLGMLLSGLPACDYLVYSICAKDYILRTVPYDEEYVVDLCSRLINVYFDIFLPKMMKEYVSVD